MRALAVETSGRVGSVALVEEGRVVAEEAFTHGVRHAVEMLPLIDRLCRQGGWVARDFAEIYVSVGPGSFTGLRIGITLAKTLSFATGARLVAVPTVRVLVENAPAEARHVVIVLDAKREQVFTARYVARPSVAVVRSRPQRAAPLDQGHRGPRHSGSVWLEREPAHLDRLEHMLARSPRPVYLLGEGLPYHQKFIPENDASVIVTPPQLWRARAGAVARLGMEMSVQGLFTSALSLAPLYIRLPEAEEKRLGGMI